MSRGDSSGQFTLGEESFIWSVKYYGGESSANTHVRGLSARVCLSAGQTRELVIEFDPTEYPAKRPASVPQLAARIQEVTALAIEDGWKPDSRGKPYRFEAPPRAV
jgi:hypothetical protein